MEVFQCDCHHLCKCISIVIFLIVQNSNVVDERILRTSFKQVITICQEHKGIHTRTQREQKIGVSIKREKIEKMMTIIQI